MDQDETKVSFLSKAQAGLIPPSLLASVKARGQSSFVRSKEAVSESSSWAACFPSISCTASWTRIRRQIPAVISQQQRGCDIVWSRVMLRPLCASYVDCGYEVVAPGASSIQVLPSAHRLKYWIGSWFFFCFFFMSPQAYMQSLGPCNVFQSIKSRKGAFCPHSLFVLQQ